MLFISSTFVYCFLDLLRFYLCSFKAAEMKVSSSAKRMAGKCHSLLWGFSTSRADVLGRASTMWEEVVALQAFHEKYDEVNGRNAQRDKFSSNKRGGNCAKSIPASLFQPLQLQSTASLLQWPCMMLRRWVLSKLLRVIIFHCHF